jgi:hypothetical protein
MMALSAERPAIGVHKNVLFGLNLWWFIKDWSLNACKYPVPQEWQAIFIPLNTDTVRQCLTTLEVIKGFLLNRILNIARKVVDQNQFLLSWTYLMTTLHLHVINPTILGVTIKHRYNSTLTNNPD